MDQRGGKDLAGTLRACRCTLSDSSRWAPRPPSPCLLPPPASPSTELRSPSCRAPAHWVGSGATLARPLAARTLAGAFAARVSRCPACADHRTGWSLAQIGSPPRPRLSLPPSRGTKPATHQYLHGVTEGNNEQPAQTGAEVPVPQPQRLSHPSAAIAAPLPDRGSQPRSRPTDE